MWFIHTVEICVAQTPKLNVYVHKGTLPDPTEVRSM